MDKITALRETIYNLENDVYAYNWKDCESCNCGVLAKTLLKGKSIYESGFSTSPLEDPRKIGPFSRAAYCITTNLPLPEIFQLLKNAGFTYEELVELEFLGNKKIGDLAGLVVGTFMYGINAAHGQFSQKGNLIKYLKAWVEILEEEKLQEKKEDIDVGNTTPQPQYIDITTRLAAESKEVRESSDVDGLYKEKKNIVEPVK